MKIVLLGAMDNEIEKYLTFFSLKKIKEDFYEGVFKSHQILVCKCGIGKVNAAMRVQYLIDTYHPDFIINSGCAGSLQDHFHLLDLALITSATYHDFLPERIMKYSVPEEGNIKTNPNMLLKIKKILKEENIPYIESSICSGDSFVTTEEQKMNIRERTHADLVDMESASIAHVARKNNVSYLILRVISDFANGEDDFEEKAAYKASEVVKKILEKI